MQLTFYPHPCPQDRQSEQFCSVTVIDGAYITRLASVRAAHKSATYRILRFPSIGSVVPSVGTITTPKIEPRSARVPSAPASVAARAACSARPSDRKAKSHASSFNSAGRVADSSPPRNSYRCHRVDGHRVFLGRLDDWRHRQQTCGRAG